MHLSQLSDIKMADLEKITLIYCSSGERRKNSMDICPLRASSRPPVTVLCKTILIKCQTDN